MLRSYGHSIKNLPSRKHSKISYMLAVKLNASHTGKINIIGSRILLSFLLYLLQFYNERCNADADVLDCTY